MGKVHDLTNQKFTRLTVIKRVENNKWGKAQWLCVCECGNNIIVTGNALLRGNTKSCGCLANENHLHHFFDIVGQRFNKLTVLKYVGKSKWLCKCDCENETIVSTSSLKSGNTKSCGCHSIENRKRPKNNFVGRRFGRLTVIEYLGNSRWLCKCECGKVKDVSTNSLRSGNVQSCGCLHKDLLVERLTKHGKTKTRLHRIWQRMKSSCNNSKTIGYKNYGGRGIKVCDEWKNDFLIFQEWALNNGYRDDLTIDRIDVNGNYEPSNCRWATKKEQARNTRKNRLITYNGETHCIAEWAENLGVCYSVFRKRLSENNYDMEQAIKKMFVRNKKYEYNGEKQTLHYWSKKFNITYCALYYRVCKKNMNIEQAIKFRKEV